MQPLNALDGDGFTTAAVDLRPHFSKTVNQINDLGLARGIL